MEWEPDVNAWNAYIKFEIKANEIERVRAIFQHYVQAHPQARVWLKFAKFEVVGTLYVSMTCSHSIGESRGNS